MVLESKAARLISSFPITSENYSKEAQQLKIRFGREDLLVQIYVQDLLSLIMKNAIAGRNSNIASLHDMLETKLRALESLGRTKEIFADFLEPLVESCLPESVLRAWERSRVLEDKDDSTSQRSLEKLMCFVSHEVESKEMINLAREGFGKNNGVLKRNNNKNIIADVPDVAMTAMLVSTNASRDGIPRAAIHTKLRWTVIDKEPGLDSSNDELIVDSSVQTVLSFAILEHLLDHVPHDFADVVQKLRPSFYVDNCLISVNNVIEGKHFIETVQKMMSRACFNLRGWESNFPCEYMRKSSGVTRVLGMLWNLDNDSLMCSINIKTLTCETRVSKRLILSLVQQMLDPIDASKKTYAACIFVQSVNSDGINVTLVRAKSRVAPLKTLSIPRLKLMACCIGAGLANSVRDALDLPDMKITFWTDSSVALLWIREHGD
ncbi:uncharacterized protein TNCV_3603551 [Trichonephila clavipes]|nr:uncharacterized protein TNCV_3603551 [Trichonephila clavipes]